MEKDQFFADTKNTFKILHMELDKTKECLDKPEKFDNQLNLLHSLFSRIELNLRNLSSNESSGVKLS